MDAEKKPVAGYWLTPEEYEQVGKWKAQAARIEALEAALEPFGDLDGEGDEDFPDETPVRVIFGRTTNYTLKLGDLRRARAALPR